MDNYLNEAYRKVCGFKVKTGLEVRKKNLMDMLSARGCSHRFVTLSLLRLLCFSSVRSSGKEEQYLVMMLAF